MTASHLSQYIGQTGVLRLGTSLRVDVSILDAKMAYGQTRLLVTPVRGDGQDWVEASRVQVVYGVLVEG